MTRRCDIVVAGAGVTGLAVAVLLSQSSQAGELSITVIDAGPKPLHRPTDDVDLRVSAIAFGSADLLAAIGAWPAVEDARYCPYDHMRVWDQDDEADGPSTLRFDADEFAVPHLGYIVENRLLRHALSSLLDATDVVQRFETPLTSIERIENVHKLTLANGDRLVADLVIGADGARSVVRESVGIPLSFQPYSQVAFVTHLEPERPHRNTAWQRFLRDGPLGMLPLADGRISVVWSTTPEQSHKAMECSDSELGELLSVASDGVLGRLTVAGPRGSFPLAAQHADDYVRHGIALIGDAAHTVHPLAGQGANLGLADARELADVVTAALGNAEYPGDRPVLRRYERARKGANASMMHFMTGLNRLFASDSSILGEVRRAGMALFNRSGPVRERVVGVALGASRR